MKVNKEAVQSLVLADGYVWRGICISMSRAYRRNAKEIPAKCAHLFDAMPPKDYWEKLRSAITSARAEKNPALKQSGEKRKEYLRNYLRVYMRIKRQKLRTVSNVV